jgi:DMSO reductase family type II enzyme heme b subunit
MDMTHNAHFACFVALAGAMAAPTGCRSSGSSKTNPEKDLARTTEALFERNCAVCHGADGRGDGPAADLLDPKPRSFRTGAFRLVSTDNGLPTEDDIVQTITRGMAGTPMPPWPQLSEPERRGLARHVLALRRDELIRQAVARGAAPADAATRAQEKLTAGATLAPAAPAGNTSAEDLRVSFVELCAKCHAEDGTGRDDPAWRTAEGHPIKSRNFKAGVFKGGRADVELYRRIAAGMPGTPMPAFGTIPAEQIWKMVRYIQSLSDPSRQEQAWAQTTAIAASRVDALPADIATWQRMDATPITLFPLWANPAAITRVDVRAAYDATGVGILLAWADPSRSTDGDSVGDFSDGAAIQLSTDADPPLFTMGEPGRAVNIWHWKGVWGVDRPKVAQGPAGAADTYYSDRHGWMFGASITDDESFLTGLAARNSVSAGPDPGFADELAATRFGTLTPRPSASPSVRVVSEWADGTWRVLFRRELAPPDGDGIALGVGGEVSVAFAVWDGAIGDRNGKKSVSIWQTLRLVTRP